MNPIRLAGRKSSAKHRRIEALLGPHVLPLYRMAYRYTGRREDAEDLVQDLLMKLHPRLKELEQVQDLKPWLVRSLYNAFIDSVRRKQREPPMADLGTAELESPLDPQDDVLALEQRHALNLAIADLNPEHRAVVMLHLVEGYSLPELSTMLGVQVGTLKSRLHRAKAQLRSALKFMEPNSSAERVGQHEV